VYEVSPGPPDLLLQSRDLRKIYLVPAEKGETIVVPPGFGHVTINPGTGELVMANIVATCFESDYGFYEEHRGAAYYELVSGDIEKNPRYPPVPPVEIRRPPGINPQSWPAGPLYRRVERRDETLRALVHPERYPSVFPRL